MKKTTTFLLLLTIVFSGAACKKEVIGEGPVLTQTRNASPFTAIDLRMNGYVYYRTDSVFKIEVSAKQSIIDQIETTISNNRLTVRYRNGKTYDADESIRINVSAPAVTSLELNTSGSIYVMNDIQPSNLMLRSYGSGSIFLQKVSTTSIDAESTRSGRITATGGSATNEKLKTDASGKIDLSAVAARNVTARIIGSGDIKVNVADELHATIQGSGSIYFRGYPSLFTNISGTGRLVHF